MEWNEARDAFADRAKGNFVDQHPMAMGVEDEIAHLDPETFESIERELYQRTIEALGEHDHVELKYEGDSPWEDVPVAALIHDGFFEQELAHLDGFFPDEEFSPDKYDDIVAEVSYDLSNELEKATGVNTSLTAAHRERALIDEAKMDALPDGTALYRLGHVPGLAVDDVDDFYDRERFEEGGYPSENDLEPFMTQKRRYVDHIKSHGGDVMAVGGTDSIQVTMRPAMTDGSDTMVRDFLGAGDGPSVPALSPVLYAPFMSSPVLDEGGELESHMGREWAYDKGFAASEYADDQKYGFIDEIVHVEGIEDAMDVFANKRFQFSASVEADELEVVGTDETLYESVSEDHEQVDEDTAFNVRVGHEDYGVIDFESFVEDQAFEGIVSLPAPDGDAAGEEVRVRADYSDMDEDTFLEEAWGHFVTHNTGFWPSYNPRFDAGAFESRDFGNSPRIKEAVDTQVGMFRRWREVQEYADEVLDMHDQYASIVRDGVTEEGLDFVLPSGHTVEEAWYGPEGEDGLLDILEDGVREAAYHRQNGEDVDPFLPDEYASGYRDAMEKYLEEGTFSEVFVEAYCEDGLGAAMAEAAVRPEDPSHTNYAASWGER